MLVPSLRVAVGQDRDQILDERQAEYTQYVECNLEQDPFYGVIKLQPLVDVPAQRFEIGYNFFSPEQLQVANNCSAHWGDCYDGATLAQNFWIVRREEKKIMEQLNERWPIPMSADHPMQTQWRNRVWIELMHWFHLQRRLRWGLSAPRPLDPTTLDIPRLNPDAPPPQPPTSEMRGYTAPLPSEPPEEDVVEDTASTTSTAPALLHSTSYTVAPLAGSSTSAPFTSMPPRASTPYSYVLPEVAVLPAMDSSASSSFTGAERRAMNRREDAKQRSQRPRGLHTRDIYKPIREVSEEYPLTRQPLVLASGERMRRVLYGNRMRGPSASHMSTPLEAPAPPSTPTPLEGPSAIAASIANPQTFHFDVLTAALKRALPNAGVTASCFYVTEEFSERSIAGQRVALDELEAISQTFRTALADIIAAYRDSLRRQESRMLTQWEDEHRAMDAEDAAFDQHIHETLGLGQSAPAVPPPQRHRTSYWVAPPSSSNLSAPPPSLVGPGMPPRSTGSDSPPPLESIPTSTDATPTNSPTYTSSSMLANHGSLTPPAWPTSSSSIHTPDFATLNSPTIMQYDTACFVDRRLRGRKLVFDASPRQRSASPILREGSRSGDGGPVIFYEDDNMTPLVARRLGQAEDAAPDWSLPEGDVEMSDNDDERDSDNEKVIASSFYRDLAEDLSVDAPMDSALVRALESFDSSTEADILNACVDYLFRRLG